jgi:hypothetical protein
MISPLRCYRLERDLEWARVQLGCCSSQRPQAVQDQGAKLFRAPPAHRASLHADRNRIEGSKPTHARAHAAQTFGQIGVAND